MMKDSHFPMLETQSIRLYLGLEGLPEGFPHSDHALIQLAPFLGQTPSCQGEVAPVTGFPSDLAGVGQVTAGSRSCDGLVPSLPG